MSRQHRERAVDLAIVAAVAAYGAVWLTAEPDSNLTDYVVLAGVACSLAWRRRHPVAVVGAVLLVRVAESFGGTGEAFVMMALFVGCFSVAERCRPIVTMLVGCVAIAVFLVTASAMGVTLSWAVASSTLGFLGAAIASGYAVASQRHLSLQRTLAAEREVQAARLRAESTVRLERETLAADLHDGLAHHVNVMVVVAESGRFTPSTEHPGTFEMIATSGRRALAELDRLLGLIRRDQDTSPTNVDAIEDLVNTISAAGFHVEVELALPGRRSR